MLPSSKSNYYAQMAVIRYTALQKMIYHIVKRWRRKTLANQQKYCIGEKTLANHQLGRSSRNLGSMVQAAG